MKQLLHSILGEQSELALVLLLAGVLLVLFTPIPAALLDFLLIANFSFALLILLGRYEPASEPPIAPESAARQS